MIQTKRTFLRHAAGCLATVPGMALFSGSGVRAESSGTASYPTVVVELFTSQGCHSCPPAERLLSELAERDDIIALEFHVDYWDYIGWKDPFADPAYTDRQRRYNMHLGSPYNYTPQMVIDGTSHAVGSRRGAVQARIEAARMKRMMALEKGSDDLATLTLSRQPKGLLNIALEGMPSDDGRYDMLFIGYDGEHTTDISRGENSGKRLTNSHVVRSMVSLARDWTGGRLYTAFPIPPNAGNSGYAVLVQDPITGRIATAATMPAHPVL